MLGRFPWFSYRFLGKLFKPSVISIEIISKIAKRWPLLKYTKKENVLCAKLQKKVTTNRSHIISIPWLRITFSENYSPIEWGNMWNHVASILGRTLGVPVEKKLSRNEHLVNYLTISSKIIINMIFLNGNFALMSKKVHKITPKIMRLFAEYLLNFKSNCWYFANSNFFYNPKIFANTLMISWQSYYFIIFLTTNSQKNEHFAIFTCISKLEKFLYGLSRSRTNFFNTRSRSE